MNGAKGMNDTHIELGQCLSLLLSRSIRTVFVLSIFWLGLFASRVNSQSFNLARQDDNKLGLTSDGGQWGFQKAPESDSSLPNVLLIGDSILQGYRKEVIRQLYGKANVDCLITPTTIGALNQLKDQMKPALLYGPYTVIHFNDMGLHAWPKGRIPEGRYGSLLRAYVNLIRTEFPRSTLIWTTTTPMTTMGIPTKLDPNNAIIVERNTIAASIMKTLNVQTDDLYDLMINRLYLARGDRFHWTVDGQTLQGKQVSMVIDAILNSDHLANGSK